MRLMPQSRSQRLSWELRRFCSKCYQFRCAPDRLLLQMSSSSSSCLLQSQCEVAGRRPTERSHQSSRITVPHTHSQRHTTPRQCLHRSLDQLLLWNAYLHFIQCMPYQLLWWSHRLRSTLLQLLSWNMFLRILQCVPHQFLWWSTSLRKLWLARSYGVQRSSASGEQLRGAYSVCCTSSCRGKHFCSSCGVCRTQTLWESSLFQRQR